MKKILATAAVVLAGMMMVGCATTEDPTLKVYNPEDDW